MPEFTIDIQTKNETRGELSEKELMKPCSDRVRSALELLGREGSLRPKARELTELPLKSTVRTKARELTRFLQTSKNYHLTTT